MPIIVLVITQLHLLRNISSAYFVIYLIALTGAIWLVISNWHKISSQEKSVIYFVLLIFLFPAFSIIPGVILGKYNSFQEVVIGIARLLFTLPIYLAILAAPLTKETVKKLVIAASVITLIAALSIPYQFISGPIGWFAESSERSGLARYSSLFGSLTTLGIACGNGLLASFVSVASVFWMSLVAGWIVVGSLLSLQKAAIANIVIAFLFLPFVRKFNAKQVVAFLSFFVILFVSAGLFFGEELDIYFSSIRLTSESESVHADDMSFAEGIEGRIVGQPSIAIGFHGVKSLLLGIGPIGGGGTFGYLDIPMAENGYVDLLLVGGVPSALLFAAFIFFVFTRLRSHITQDSNKYFVRFGTLTFIMLLVNMTFSGLIFFSPSNAMFFAIALKCILLNKKHDVSKQSQSRSAPDEQAVRLG